jgi:trafficking protein particle complex subunit 11
LQLYLADHLRVIQTFNSHNKRWSTLLNGWGLGVETADYWHWLSRNYRIFAELLDISETVIVGENEIENAIKLITGDSILGIDSVLHHSGYYYLVSANCIRQQHARIPRQDDEKAEDGESSETDLNTQLFEMLTLSAEQFIRRGQRRLAAYVELARCKTQHFAGNYNVVMEYSRT